MRAAALLIALAAVSCRRAPPPGPAPAGELVAVPQRSLGLEAMIFHPQLARVGQLRDGACDVWDLDEQLYRGQVPDATCKAWADAPSRPVPGNPGPSAIDFDVDSTYPGPAGRYAGYLGKSGGRLPPRHAAVVRLADGKVVLSSIESPRFDKLEISWARDRAAALAVRRHSIPLEPCNDEQLQAELRSLDGPPVRIVSIPRGKLTFASIAPDASMALLSFTEMDECSEQVLATREKRQSTWIYRRAGAETGEPMETWSGRGPVAVSPDGARVASLEWSVLTVRAAGQATRAGVDDARALAWIDGSLAFAPANGAPPARAGGAVSADGAFEMLDDAVRRLADGEVLRFSDEGPQAGSNPATPPSAYTESGAFDRVTPRGLVLRDGDTLTGALLRAEGATFLHPTPDLVSRFASGKPIPHPARP